MPDEKWCDDVLAQLKQLAGVVDEDVIEQYDPANFGNASVRFRIAGCEGEITCDRSQLLAEVRGPFYEGWLNLQVLEQIARGLPPARVVDVTWPSVGEAVEAFGRVRTTIVRYLDTDYEQCSVVLGRYAAIASVAR